MGALRMGLRLTPWRKFPLTLSELCIDTTLICGQAFRWKKLNDEWRCSLHGRVVFLKQDEQYLHFRAGWPERRSVKKSGNGSEADDDTEALLRSYFNLEVDLGRLYGQWSRDDANFRKKAPKFGGIRILNQDAWEALVCFICSSNNNIGRIAQMAHKLCVHYGEYLGSCPDGDEQFYDFPTADALAKPGVEARLRELGFGYRAKYVAQTAQTLSGTLPNDWLVQLRNTACPQWPGKAAAVVAALPATTAAAAPIAAPAPKSSYATAHQELLVLDGVGPKVADCVCLMGLGWGEAVPVDTHVWQIAVRDYKFGKAGSGSKTLSKPMYDAVGNHFRNLWGSYAGWAQSVLFTANLKTFSERPEPAGAIEQKKKRPGVEAERDEDVLSNLPAKKRRRSRR